MFILLGRWNSNCGYCLFSLACRKVVEEMTCGSPASSQSCFKSWRSFVILITAPWEIILPSMYLLQKFLKTSLSSILLLDCVPLACKTCAKVLLGSGLQFFMKRLFFLNTCALYSLILGRVGWRRGESAPASKYSWSTFHNEGSLLHEIRSREYM